ncbi:MAG TPA: glycerol-3-phosphate 1-O-acyltransferase PlsY [Anaeromyxobacteraceae bacterium]|nr:glycerol-3-phosphate 1-O-acyltransferase PlsY [Anaeromyxobacteraceae bacterium]
MMLGVLFVVAAYLVGSIPFGVVLTKLFTGKDVRSVGSGNIGASNVSRAAGKKVGVLTLILDAAKASVPMLVAERLFADPGTVAGQGWAVAVGVAAFLGHLYPVWLGFKGGKGVATALGVFAVLAPIPSLLALVAFGIGYGTTRIPAIGSLAGTATCCIGAIVQEMLRRGGEAWAGPVPWASLALAAVIVLRHRSNIERLIKGAEHKA